MKRKSNMMALLIAAVMLVALAPLAAQSSSTATATAGIFETDADNFMSNTDYSTVEMDKSLLFAEYLGGNLGLGYARKLGGLYLGTYYTGNVLDLNNSANKISIDSVDTLTNGQYVGTVKTTTTDNDNTSKLTDNELKVLVGFANMGIKLGMYENLSFSDKLDNGNTVIIEDSLHASKNSKEYTDISVKNGGIGPSVSWGMRMPLGGLTFKPIVSGGVYLSTASTQYTYNESTENFGVKDPDTTTTKVDGQYKGMYPNVGIGLNFETTGDNKKEFGLSYNLNLQSLSNKYTDAFGSAKTIDGTVWASTKETKTVTNTDSTTEVKNSAYTTETTSISHSAGLYFEAKKPISSAVSFGYGAGLGINYSSWTNKGRVIETVKKTYDKFTQDPADDYVEEETRNSYNTRSVDNVGNTDGDVEASQLSVNPSIRSGVTYQVVPGTFVINAGVNVALASFSRFDYTISKKDLLSNTKTTTYGDGTVTKSMSGDVAATSLTRNETKRLSVDWDSYNATVYGGASLFVTPKVTVDAVLSSSSNLSLSCTIKK